MSEVKRNELRELLEEHESAPSAVNFLLANMLGIDCVGDVNTNFLDILYESGEGVNDMARDALLNYFDIAQLDLMIANIIKFCKDNTEEGDEKECACSTK